MCGYNKVILSIINFLVKMLDRHSAYQTKDYEYMSRKYYNVYVHWYTFFEERKKSYICLFCRIPSLQLSQISVDATRKFRRNYVPLWVLFCKWGMKGVCLSKWWVNYYERCIVKVWVFFSIYWVNVNILWSLFLGNRRGGTVY